MPSRFQIREAVVKFLYCADLEGDTHQATFRCSIWDMVTESDRRNLQEARFWTVQQLAQERKISLIQFVECEAISRKLISAWSRAGSLRDNLEQIAALESGWSTEFSKFDEILKANVGKACDVNIGSMIDSLIHLDRSLADARREFLMDLESFPVLQRQLELVARKISELVSEADARRIEISSSEVLPQSPKNEDGNTKQCTVQEAKGRILLSAWQLYRNRRKRRTPRATAAVLLSEWPQAESLEIDLKRINEHESKWSTSYARLERLINTSNIDHEEEEYNAELTTLFKQDRDLAESRCKFLENLKRFPFIRGQLEAIIATIHRLQLISDILQMAENPEEFPNQADLARLIDSKKELFKLREQSAELVDMILVRKEQIDAALAAVVENFVPERIDPVDRAILRLGTYELLHAVTPPKVVMNECIDLAKRFGTTDSRRFVNGVLDKIAKQAVEQSEK